MLPGVNFSSFCDLQTHRAKGLDWHPSQPWLLSTFHPGFANVWDYNEKAVIKVFYIDFGIAVRTGKFIASKEWVILGTDSAQIFVFSYTTMQLIKRFKAHTDYIRVLSIHPTLPYVLSCSDDKVIKLWDWDKDWKEKQVFKGHDHYVMCVEFNPHNPDTFASASLDSTVKIWNLKDRASTFTFTGHEHGVDWVDYCHLKDKPLLISGADDKTVKIWDYEQRACLRTISLHSNNVCCTVFHPWLPIFVSGSEDQKLLSGFIFEPSEKEKAYRSSMCEGGRIWMIAHSPSATARSAVACDKGVQLVEINLEANGGIACKPVPVVNNVTDKSIRQCAVYPCDLKQKVTVTVDYGHSKMRDLPALITERLSAEELKESMTLLQGTRHNLWVAGSLASAAVTFWLFHVIIAFFDPRPEYLYTSAGAVVLCVITNCALFMWEKISLANVLKLLNEKFSDRHIEWSSVLQEKMSLPRVFQVLHEKFPDRHCDWLSVIPIAPPSTRVGATFLVTESLPPSPALELLVPQPSPPVLLDSEDATETAALLEQ